MSGKKKNNIRIGVSIFLLLVMAYVAIPKYYFHQWLGHHHGQHLKQDGKETINENKETQDCELEKYESPAFFTLFRFILEFSPLKSNGKVGDNGSPGSPNATSILFRFLRAPPISQ